MAMQLMADADRDEVAAFIERHWGARVVMSSGQSWFPHEHEALIERRNGEIVGLVTFRCDDGGMEILTVNSTVKGAGVGSRLMLAAIDLARDRNIERVWLTTTNDNLAAIGLHQRIGFRIVAVRSGAVDEARRVKPQIPEVGENGIPIHDEIVMELRLKPALDPHGEDEPAGES